MVTKRTKATNNTNSPLLEDRAIGHAWTNPAMHAVNTTTMQGPHTFPRTGNPLSRANARDPVIFTYRTVMGKKKKKV